MRVGINKGTVGDVDKGLVEGVDLDMGSDGEEKFLEAASGVEIEVKLGGLENDAWGAQFGFTSSGAGDNSEGFGFFGCSDNASTTDVFDNTHWFAAQARIFLLEEGGKVRVDIDVKD